MDDAVPGDDVHGGQPVARRHLHADRGHLRSNVPSEDHAAGTVNAVAGDVKGKLTGAGFEVVGEYSPYAGAHVIGVTNDALKGHAAKSERGGYGAVMRVSVTDNAGNIEVAYSNPIYWANAYRMNDNLDGVSAKLETALGAQKQFSSGDKELTAEKMRKYHYTIMMEYFDDPSELNEYNDHADAVKTIESNLAAGKGNAMMVYKVSVGKDPDGKEMTLFGVGLKGKNEDDCSSDPYIMSRVDKADPRSTAHLPYEIVVSDGTAYALYARFRIAINWPHLPMVASKTGATFMNIMCSPGAIEEALIQAAGEEP